MNTSGDRLKALLLECNLTSSDFAAHRDITPQHVNNWFKRGVPLARLDEIAELFCVHPRWLRTGEGPKHPDPLVAPRAAVPRAEPPKALLEPGSPSISVALHHIREGRLTPSAGLHQCLPAQALDNLGVNARHAICVAMPGCNMAPLIPQGALLAIDRSVTWIADGEYHALLLDGHLRVHQLSHGPNDTLCLHSHDRLNHPVERLTPNQRRTRQLEIVGWVFWWACLRAARPA
ncbi:MULTISPECIES: LexA family transcriptional regulator [Pseudomonas]|uniref:Helix-turn-helix transcriptional regulator n=1 Tax=Pseudomonas mosselii TaxID=78327 RepID=A0A5R8YN48_9PSED|nr:XRE family transcriptional regulator [Pseudomonas mosselii]TLP54899.1 helix-turn-helix transcriptional regulator [Pseudomonas mosselii]